MLSPLRFVFIHELNADYVAFFFLAFIFSSPGNICGLNAG